MTMRVSILFILVCLAASGQPMPPTNAVMTHYPVRLAWDPSPDSTVAGYNLFSGPASGTYTNAQDVGTNLTGVVWSPIGVETFYVVTAYNSNGLESIPSNETNYIPVRPAPPSGIRVLTISTVLAIERAPSLAGPWIPTNLLVSISITNPTGTELFRARWDRQLSATQTLY